MNIFKGVLQWSLDKGGACRETFYFCYTITVCPLGKIKEVDEGKGKKGEEIFLYHPRANHPRREEQLLTAGDIPIKNMCIVN